MIDRNNEMVSLMNLIIGELLKDGLEINGRYDKVVVIEVIPM